MPSEGTRAFFSFRVNGLASVSTCHPRRPSRSTRRTCTGTAPSTGPRGSGPTVVLIHGMINSSRHWESVARRLAGSYRVIAPDLIGHGDAATPRGDYSLGAHAASIRDLLTTIGVERATIVGHSLGGGVAMQFFYQFPQRTERLVLVSSGGLGRDVSPLLRGAALPGSAALLRLATRPRLVGAIAAGGAKLRERGNSTGVYLQAVARALGPLQEPGSRRAFLQTLQAVIDVQGQKVSATDRLYLLQEMPTLIVWGERDRTIPLAHGLEAQRVDPQLPLRDAAARRPFPQPRRPGGPCRRPRRLPRHHLPRPHRRLRVAGPAHPAGAPAPRRVKTPASKSAGSPAGLFDFGDRRFDLRQRRAVLQRSGPVRAGDDHRLAGRGCSRSRPSSS